MHILSERRRPEKVKKTSHKGIQVYSKYALDKGSTMPEHLSFFTFHVFNKTQLFFDYKSQ